MIYDMCKKSKPENCSQKDDFFKESISISWDTYNTFLIHLTMGNSII
jgi:hypothetical protein